MKYLVKIDGKEFDVEITEKEGELFLKLDRKEYAGHLLEISEQRYSILLGNTVLEWESEKKKEGYQILWKGKRFTAQVQDQNLAQIARVSPDTATPLKEIKSPLPGVVVRIEVKEEEEGGKGVVIVEDMKIENENKSLFAGRKKKIEVRKTNRRKRPELGGFR